MDTIDQTDAVINSFSAFLDRQDELLPPKVEYAVRALIQAELHKAFNVGVGLKYVENWAGVEAERLKLVPHYKHSGDAAFDLYAILPPEHQQDGLTIFPGERKPIHTGWALQMPEGTWGHITHRSSCEKKYRLRVVSGTIDQGYSGELITQLANENSFPVVIKHKDRYAQLILTKIVKGTFSIIDSIAQTDRGANGFGSTGA